MSSNLCALLSATFYEEGYSHYVEIVHQRDCDKRKRLEKLNFLFYAPDGKELGRRSIDPNQNLVDLRALVHSVTNFRERIMVLTEVLYDANIFPYRPHHYALFHREGSKTAPVYYAFNAALGGVPDRIGAVSINHLSVFLFPNHAHEMDFSVIIGNPSRFATVKVNLLSHYEGGVLKARSCRLPPKGHVEVPLMMNLNPQSICRVEMKGVGKPIGFVVGRKKNGGEILHFDHFFPYLKVQ